MGFALYQAGQARAGYESSRQRFEQIRNLANTLLFETDDMLVGLEGATEVQARLVKNALGYLDQLARNENKDPRLQEELAAAYEKVGDIQGRLGTTNLGQTAQALESYRKCEAIRESIRSQARKADGFIPASNNLARTYARISATLCTMGDTQGAPNYERKALGIREALYGGDPDNLEFKRALASSLTTLSGSLSQVGDFQAVADTRREALKMFEEIVARQPDSKPDLRGLALALARMGSIEMHENQLESNLQHYQRALDIDSRLYLRDTTDVQNRLNKGWAHNNYGLILNRLGRHNDALAQFSAAKPFFESVSSADDSDVRGKTLLETNHARTAETLLSLDRHREALEQAEISLKGREYLAGLNRYNVGAQGEVAETHVTLGRIKKAMGRIEDARSHFLTARNRFEDLIRNERSNFAIKEDLAAVEKEIQALAK
ncbi:MAG: hypothetical protein FJW36_17095 [Acidobacteria bacterium]|nr:hypothetical protein [Acidobacteriota bacterium]